MLSRRARIEIAAGAVAVLLITALVAFRWGAGSVSDPSAAPETTPAVSESSIDPLSTADIYTTLLPSVVSIEVTRADATDGAGPSDTAAPGTTAGPGDPAPESTPTSSGPPIVTAAASVGTGTGVIANADGSILTALHVVENADSIQVTFADGTRSAAELAASDVATDMAILVTQTLPSVVVPALLGGGVVVGDPVIAIGNPLGLIDSTTTGVVSGLNRSGPRENGGDLQGLIQFDAAVNPGSSGGPLINARGETVGIVVALVNPTEADTFIGIGFAVPIGTALATGGDGPDK